MHVQVIKRSQGHSPVAAAAYRAGEKLWDERRGRMHDYTNKKDIVHTEMMLPVDAPAWVRGISREDFWNSVDRAEKRVDAQTARELRIMIPRELPQAEQIALVRDFVTRCFVRRGMLADVAVHNPPASDGARNPHAHVMLIMRPLTDTGFAAKSRHDWVKDPSGRTHPDGKPVMVESNPDSWNSAAYYEACRLDWEKSANAALERIGSVARIDRRTLLERGLARMPEPALRLALHMKELNGRMKARFGQWHVARHYRAVEERAKLAFRALEAGREPAPAAHGGRHNEPPHRKVERFWSWIDRQLERLPLRSPIVQPGQSHAGFAQQREPRRDIPDVDLER